MSVDPQYWQAENNEWRETQVATFAAEDGATTTESVETPTIKMEMPMTFELLYSDDIWICDSGASSHSGKNKRGAKNIKNSGSQSLGHTGKAVEALNTMDIAGQFYGKD